MKILKIELSNFKGCKSAEYDFGDRTNVYGMNGTGKTTIADSILWVFTDKNISNEKVGMKIRNIFEVEKTPSVRIWFEHNGIEYDIEKSQKLETNTRNGIESRKTINNFRWNGQTITLKAINENLKDIGIDNDNFMMLVNPIDFLNRKQADVRKVIMRMAGSFTDIDIALQIGQAPDVASLLDQRTLEEIEATAKGTISKLKSEYGKNGEMIDAKIEALMESKTDGLDRAKIEEEKAKIQAEIEQIQAESSLSLSQTADKNAMERIVRELKEKYVKQLEIIFKTTNSLYNSKIEELKTIKNTILNADSNIRNRKREIERSKEIIEEYEKKILDIQNKDVVVDEVCPTCNRELPKVDVLHAKQRLEQQYQKTIDGHKDRIDREKAFVEECEKTIVDNQVILDNSNKELEEKQQELENTKFFKSTNEINYKDYPELVNLVDEIKEKDEQIKSFADEHRNDKYSAMANRLGILEDELKHLDNEMALVENNENIDKRIEEYKAEKIDVVGQKLKAEKILYQIGLINKAKNEIVVDEINSHFKKVKWKLFEYQMNGEYKEICEPTIDDKPLFSSVNTGKRLEAEVDILDGLQNFYGQNLPIILDNAECLDSTSKEKIKTNRQLILLNVSNIDKDLRVEGE